MVPLPTSPTPTCQWTLVPVTVHRADPPAIIIQFCSASLSLSLSLSLTPITGGPCLSIWGGRVRGHILLAGYIQSSLNGKIQAPPVVVGQEGRNWCPHTRSPKTPCFHSPPSPGWRTRHWLESWTGRNGRGIPGGSSEETPLCCSWLLTIIAWSYQTGPPRSF